MPVDYKFDSAIFGDQQQFDIKALYYFTLTESTPVDDSINRQVTYKRRIFEPSASAKFDDAIFGSDTQFDVALDSYTWNDIVTGIRMRLADISEPAITISDSLARTLLAKAALVENVVVSEVLSRIAIFKRVILEPARAIFDDALFGDVNQFDTAAQSIPISDSVVGQAKKVADMSENVIFNDVATRIYFAFRTISEPIVNFADQTVRILMAKRNISEPSISDSDSVVAQRTAIANISESVPMSETLTRIYFAFRNITESAINFADQVATVQIAKRTLAEPAIIIDDNVTGLRKFIINLSESLNPVTDTLAITLFNLILFLTSYIKDTLAQDSTVKDSLSSSSTVKDSQDL